MEGLPYIDFRLYNVAKVEYDINLNAVKNRYAGASQYERRRQYSKVRFYAPYAEAGDKRYYLVGYRAFGEGEALLFCVLGVPPTLCAGVFCGKKFMGEMELNAFFSGEYFSVVKLNKYGRPRIYALENLIKV